MASDGESADETCRVPFVFRPKARAASIAPAAVAAKRARRGVMEADGYSEWQMNRAESQRVSDGIGDDVPVVQSVYRTATVPLYVLPEVPPPMVPPLMDPAIRPFLRESVPGVTVCRPWADARYLDSAAAPPPIDTQPDPEPVPKVFPSRGRAPRASPIVPIAGGWLQEQPVGYDPTEILRRARK